MQKVISGDGTPIAYERTGNGPALVLVAGAFGHRQFPALLEFAEAQSPYFTVYNYDRRGRGDSGDTPPYAVEREIEDLQAVIDATGGNACVWGQNSGAVLALRAAAAGVPMRKLALHEPPLPAERPEFTARLTELIAADKRADAVKYFLTTGMGVPAFAVRMMRMMPPVWQHLTGIAHTLPYDAKVLGAAEWASAKLPILVVDGEKSDPGLRKAAADLTAVLPDARRRTLEGQDHNVSMSVMAPVVREFFLD